MNQITRKLYHNLRDLPRLNHLTPTAELPSNGIYTFFEKGEIVTIDDISFDRIVRVGTHKSDNRFKGRIRQHYGNKSSLRGNKNGSVFRKHLGGALISKSDPKDIRLSNWLTQGGPSFPEVEEMVSMELREHFTFSCWPVETKEERLSLEEGLIALLAQFPMGQPTDRWLGKYAESDIIKRSGLWNVNSINAFPISEEGIDRLVELNTLSKGI